MLTDEQIAHRLNSEVDRMLEGSYPRQRAMAWLMVGLINDHFPHPEEVEEAEDDPVLGTGGCVINCGPCGALKWFSDNARVQFDDYVRLTGYQSGGWSYWNDELDSLRWDWFDEYWSRHKACWMSNGKLGCYGEDDENAEVSDGN